MGTSVEQIALVQSGCTTGTRKSQQMGQQTAPSHHYGTSVATYD